MEEPRYTFEGEGIPPSKAGELCAHKLWRDGFLIKCACCAGKWAFNGMPIGSLVIPGGLPWCLNSGDSICVMPHRVKDDSSDGK